MSRPEMGRVSRPRRPIGLQVEGRTTQQALVCCTKRRRNDKRCALEPKRTVPEDPSRLARMETCTAWISALRAKRAGVRKEPRDLDKSQARCEACREWQGAARDAEELREEPRESTCKKGKGLASLAVNEPRGEHRCLRQC